ncbi:MAG TPA: CHAD domain-containing protein [Solirubrobacteraceae bacterium]|nr:CHAD domain-containing protein [Solirubrobacteraceae bacterium]
MSGGAAAGGAVARAKVDVALAYDQRADAAAVAVLRRLLEVIRENLDGSIAGEDDEYLHQLRIAVRRSRTVQRQLHGVFDPVELPGFRSEFRWLQQVTGPARDLDVYVGELPALAELLPERLRSDLAPLRPVLAHRRLTARAEMTRALRSVRTTDLLEDWDRLLESLVERPRDDRPLAGVPIGEAAGERIRTVYRRIVHMGRRIEISSPAAEYHELRKKAKELRYLLELFGVKLFDAEHVGSMVKALKSLQDVLGRHQDREVQMAMLHSTAGEVATLPGGAAACMAMGVLVDRLERDEGRAREEFGERFDTFASHEQRALVKHTFA